MRRARRGRIRELRRGTVGNLALGFGAICWHHGKPVASLLARILARTNNGGDFSGRCVGGRCIARACTRRRGRAPARSIGVAATK
jgi:hypothetical protein